MGTAWLISLKRTMKDEERWAGGETANMVLPGRPDCLGREVPTLIIADGTILAPGGVCGGRAVAKSTLLYQLSYAYLLVSV